MKNTDVELIHLILEGDDTAFATLVKKYQKHVHALAWRKIGDFHIAEEITQDTFLKVYQKLDTLKNPNQFSGWLYVIATRRCLAWLRKKRMETESLEDMDTEMIEETAYSEYVAGEKAKVTIQTQREVVKKLLSKLKESERTVMILHYFGEMTCEEISRFLGVSPSAIKSRLSRARQRLKKEEPMIREALNNFQISANLTKNIMREVAHLNPIAPSGSNPFVPWVLAASGIILIVLILGMGSQYLARFQQPYSLDAQSEMTVELIDAPIVQNSDAKPNIKNLIGKHSDTIGRGNGTGQESNQVLTDTVDYTQWALPEGAKARIGKGWLTGNIAFSPDGNRLAVAGIIGIWLYDARLGKVKELDLLTGHTDRVQFVSFSPDGNTIASASSDMTVRLWEVATGKHIATLEGHTGPVLSIAFSPDGKTIATGSADNTVLLWDTHTAKHTTTLKGHTGTIYNIAYSPDGNMIATTSKDKTVRLWDPHTGKHKITLKEHTHIVTSLAYSPDGRTIATGSYDNTARLWDTQTAKHITTLNGHTDSIRTVVYSPDGKTIATGSSDKTARLWDAHTGKQKHKTILGDQKASVLSIAYSPDGKTIATRSDFTVRLWDAHTGRHKIALTGHARWGPCVAISPDGKTIATGNEDTTAQLWDAHTRKPKTVLSGHTKLVTCVAFSPDGKKIATGSYDKTARLWDANMGQHITTLTGHTKYIISITFSLDGKTIATGSDDKTVRLWDAKTGNHKSTLSEKENRNPVWGVAFSPDGNTLACALWTGCRVELWDTRTWKRVGKLRLHSTRFSTPATFIAYSPDSNTIATAASKKSVQLWDLNTRKSIVIFKGHTGEITSAAFSPDGTILATGSEDYTVRLWDLRTKTHLTTLQGHTLSVQALAFSPNSSTLASISWDGTILLWKLR